MGSRSILADAHGRQIHKLRVQLTDACNFRCFYCIPLTPEFLPSAALLSSNELLDICSALVDFGIDEIRVSGGEPTLRKDFETIIKGLSDLPLGKLGLTTNGFLLEGKLDFLKQTRCQHINISLDSLRAERFHEITKTKYFEKVYQAVLQAKAKGFQVKVNTVVMRGINDDEIMNFVKFSSDHDVEVRFLELMKIGCSIQNHSRYFVPAQEIIKKIEESETLLPQSVNQDSTSFNFTTASGAKVGFIASESQSFCSFCSRLRLTATGKLRACIMSESGIDLRGISKEQYPAILRAVLRMKPLTRIDHIQQPMYQIGG
ncbi:MAG: cyclic pyranopterin phosphate synthase MoaA [Omnitrophica WOR_2 bacterium RIFCSPHIGHO2_01_FULL_48_9]|nr:MAG: cyclic pyranopterin phosphate synthase MoaA [Omnitrophica WOR_2 bacterium RIFCSPHIGHO2_01_FULL_48_9]